MFSKLIVTHALYYTTVMFMLIIVNVCGFLGATKHLYKITHRLSTFNTRYKEDVQDWVGLGHIVERCIAIFEWNFQECVTVLHNICSSAEPRCC